MPNRGDVLGCDTLNFCFPMPWFDVFHCFLNKIMSKFEM